MILDRSSTDTTVLDLRKRLAWLWKERLAPGYEWPRPENVQSGDFSPGGHSARGRLLKLSCHLIEQAEQRLERGIFSTRDAITGAILATEALELLGGRTPTTSLEALSLKHQFEVLAECQFIGIRHNIEVEDRVKDIRRELEVIALSFRPRDRKASALDAEVSILGKLIGIFQRHNQFDEEMECLYWQRKAMPSLVLRRQPIFGWLVWLVWRYMNCLIRSPVRFVVAIALWMVFGALVLGSGAEWISWSTATAFFASDFLEDAEKGIASFLFSILGLFHFGVFVSYVYTLISRK